MTVRGLPPIDVPEYLRDPYDCRRCKHSYYDSDSIEPRNLRCGKSQFRNRCLYERHETGDCTEAALHFKLRGVE